VDADYLPTGISLSEALGAVSNAIAAWEAVSSVRFSYQGIQSFGQPADTISSDDGTLWIQLHDIYGSITGPSTLGIGGRGLAINPAPADWTNGGEVFGNDFYETTEGYVVLKHTKAGMQVLSTFEEVLCHELGHALSMAHTTPDTPATVGSPAWEAQMYYIAHQDGRGAFPTSWDSNVLNQVYPVASTPPYMFDRVMDITTQPSGAPSVPGINEIQLTGYDLDNDSLSFAIDVFDDSAGTYLLSGDNLTYTPGGFIGAPRVDPAGSSFYELAYVRASDGVHASPVASARVVSFNPDRYPTPSDGIPDDWMTLTNGWDADPALGINHGANDDADGDTLTNLDEYRAAMDATSASSAQLVRVANDGTISWQARAYELYELYSTTNLVDWRLVKVVLPTNNSPSVPLDPPESGLVAYRVLKVK
jgi:hypothetical protein